MSSKQPDPMSVSTVERRLKELKDIPPRNPLQAASGRARFLRQAEEYQQAVSHGKEVRQSKWKFLRPIRKEKFAMNAFVALILVASLILGGGATVAAAQDDLPNEPLYRLKLLKEDATLALNDDPQEQANLLLDMAETRLEEIEALDDLDITPPEEVSERLEEHLNQALDLAEELDDETCEQLLLDFEELVQYHKDGDLEALRTRAREMLQEHLQLSDESLADFEELHDKMQEQMQEYGHEGEFGEEFNHEEAVQDWLDKHPADEYEFDDESFEELWDEMFDRASLLESHEWNSENGFNHEFMEEHKLNFQNDGNDFGHGMDWEHDMDSGHDMDWGNGEGWGGFH